MRMVVSGVRSSCETAETNALFCAFSSSARRPARCTRITAAATTSSRIASRPLWSWSGPSSSAVALASAAGVKQSSTSSIAVLAGSRTAHVPAPRSTTTGALAATVWRRMTAGSH
jgi:hypothetical protein